MFLIFITSRKRSLGQGNIFVPVCHSVHGGGVVVCLSACWDTTPLALQTPPRSRHPTPWEQTPPTGTRPSPWDQTPPGADTPWDHNPPHDQTPTPRDQTPPGQCMLGDTGNKRAVRILLECNLVLTIFRIDLNFPTSSSHHTVCCTSCMWRMTWKPQAHRLLSSSTPSGTQPILNWKNTQHNRIYSHAGECCTFSYRPCWQVHCREPSSVPHAMADPEFPREGCQSKRGSQPIIGKKLVKTAWKWKKLNRERVCPFGSVAIDMHCFYWKKINLTSRVSRRGGANPKGGSNLFLA